MTVATRDDAGGLEPKAGASSDDALLQTQQQAAQGDSEKVDDAAADASTTASTSNGPDVNPYKHLPDDQEAILRRQVDTPDVHVGLMAIYSYASTTDLLIVLLSCIMSIGSGVTMPLMIIVFGNVQSTLQDFFHGINADDFSHVLNHVVLYFVYLAIGSFVATYVYTIGFIYTGEHITAKIREAYLEHCLRQNIAFFDQAGTGEIVSRITADTNLIQEGISQKVGLTIAGVSTFVAAFVIGFIKYWKLALILLSVFVVIVLNMTIGSMFMMKYGKQSVAAYAPGASLIDEVISSIRTTVAFGTQERQAKKFNGYLKNVELFGFRAKTIMGVMMAVMAMIANFGYALAFWVGGKYVVYDGLQFSRVLITVMVMFMGSFSLGNVSSNAQAFTTAIAAAKKIFTTIHRPSPLDPFNDAGETLSSLEGTLEFDNIKHIYPSRPDVVVLDGMTLSVPARKTTALVGASGSGKSTIIGLVERFYEPISGSIKLDGHDISTLNLRWLRRQVSLVSQEPVLFSTSIFNNIKQGLIGTQYEHQSEDVQKDLIMNAAMKANAHDFISGLPEGYETDVGTRGGLMSGGQKQRIAIARAIVANPKILLLDEATSALDTKSEGVVQRALEAASEGRTTIVIAHRLSTIKNADNIVVMARGAIVEQGTHDELIEKRGAYYDLVVTQDTAQRADPETMTEKALEYGNDDDFARIPSSKTLSKHDYSQEIARLSLNSDQPAAISLTEQIDNLKGNRYSLQRMLGLILSFNREETIHMLFGFFFSVISGGAVPGQAVLLAKAISNLSTPLTPSNRAQVKHDSDFWAAMYLVLGGILGFAYGAHGILFAKCSERLIFRARYAVFRSLLRQDIKFFDEKQNTVGGLTSFLSTKTVEIAGLSGSTLGNLLISATTLIGGLAVGIAFGWKLGLVCTSTVPILIGCGFFRVWIMSKFQQQSQTAYAESASYASEAVSAIHTVASLTRENDVLENYRSLLAGQRRDSIKSTLQSTLLFSLSEALTLLIFALCFWYGGTLITSGGYTMFQYFVCFASVLFGAQSAGAFFSHAANMSKALSAAQDLRVLFDRRPTIDTWSPEGNSIASCKGHVEFRNVHFHYPTRPEYPVLRGINIDIRPGQHIALVGSSGCGKSTSISLIERFYNPTQGGIFIDGKDISTLNINQYRALIGLVSQEPTLYSGTIRENVLLGAANDDEAISEERVIKACQDANIYTFISSLPDGFDTIVGSKGVLLSGGQKQRLAIARALIRDPKILLLDEATSALDSESETVVQAALDNAAAGRTTITVAHRISTIRKANVIYVFNHGQITEQGTYGELERMNGHFAEILKLQTLSDES